MKLLLLGATGRIGSQVLEQAVAAGHTVTVLARHPEAIALKSPNLTVVPGDATNHDQLASLVTGQDAIISTLGHFGPKYSDVSTTAARTVLEQLAPSQRYIGVTGQVPDPKDPPQPFLGQLANNLIKRLPGNVYGDGLSHYHALKASDKNWIMARFPRLSGGKLTGTYRVGYFPVGALDTLSYPDAAAFLLSQTSSDEWLRQAPMVVR